MANLFTLSAIVIIFGYMRMMSAFCPSESALSLRTLKLKLKVNHPKNTFRCPRQPSKISSFATSSKSEATMMSMNKLEQDAEASNEEKGKKEINILCLHGKGNCGSTFQKILAPLEEALKSNRSNSNTNSCNSGVKFNFDYLTAPFSMGADNNENNDNDNNERMQWWTLPP
eukprot:112959_1